MIKELEEIIKIQKEIDKLNNEQIDLTQKIYNIEQSKEYNKLFKCLAKKYALEHKINSYYENFNKIKEKLNKICIPASIIITIVFLVLIFNDFLFYSILFSLSGMGLTYIIFKKAIEKEEKNIDNVDIKKLESEKEKIEEEKLYQEKINKKIKRRIYKYDDLYLLKKQKIDVLENKRNIIINNLKNKVIKKGVNKIINNDNYLDINEKSKKYVLKI